MMNRKLSFCLLGLWALSGAAWAQGAKDVATLTDIVALEQTWLKSQQTNDSTVLAPLLADTIADTSTEGKLMSGKDAAIADAKSVHWSKAEYTEMQVNVYGDTAIATGIFTGTGKDTAGKPVDVHERFTDTWVRMSDGKWRCVATHGSVIGK
jgi:ketosteroid isomerase-like protein